MRELLIDLITTLGNICPAFIEVPFQTPFPYITIEPGQTLRGLPGGPTLLKLNVKIWSRYKGTKEILQLARAVENDLETYAPKAQKVSLKMMESTLVLLSDKKTRVHTFCLKARLGGTPQ